MKSLYHIIIKGLRQARYYIEARNVHLKYILLLSLIPILIMTLNNFSYTHAYFKNIQDQILQVQAFLPDFSYNQSQLLIKETDKSLYYQSDDVQIVIDDQVKTNPLFHNVPMSKEKIEQVDNSAFFQLYLLRDQAFINIGQNAFEIENPEYVFIDKYASIKLLEYFKKSSTFFSVTLFVTTFVLSLFIYSLIIIATTIFVALFNRFLNQSLDFKTRLKIIIPLTFVPLILIEGLRIFFPELSFPLLLFACFILYIYYLSFKDHTLYMNTLIKVHKTIEKEELALEQEIRRENEEFDKLLNQHADIQRQQKDLLAQYNKSKHKETKKLLESQMEKLEIHLIHIEVNLQQIKADYIEKKNNRPST